MESTFYEQQHRQISEINIGRRFRKDIGDIDALVESIMANGLLVPVIVTNESLLIDGARRLEAYRKLSIPEILIHVVNVPIKENGEIDANLVRKSFTVEEILAIKKYRESIEPNLQGKRTDLDSEKRKELRGKFPRSSMERRQKRIAQGTGYSYKTLEKLEEIAKAAQEYPEKFSDSIAKIDSGSWKVNRPWKELQRHRKRKELIGEAINQRPFWQWNEQERRDHANRVEQEKERYFTLEINRILDECRLLLQQYPDRKSEIIDFLVNGLQG